MLWRMSRTYDQEARKIADDHYSRQTVGASGFTGIGKPLVLLAPHDGPAKALWVTLWQPYVRHGYTNAWQCTLFRNTGAGLSSALITQAVAATMAVWGGVPDNGFITMVNRDKTRPKKDPGYCYRCAGWRNAGRTKGGLYVLRLAPEDFPPPALPHGAQLDLGLAQTPSWVNAVSENVAA